jgi:NAD(P)-dependent dehydrogenase (short-subunit alcohol dehydrogenase family)
LKRVVITGGTAGIGKAAATELARRGAALTLLARDEGRGREAVAEIERASPGTPVEFVRLDLADLDSVRNAASVLFERHERIDVLIANAGVHLTESHRTREGFDQMLAANYLGHYLLTRLLVGAIEAAAPARIVVVASEAYRLAGRLDPEAFEDIGEYGRVGSFRAYGRTKLLDALFAFELARRLQETGVSANGVDPGTVSTGLYAQIPGFRRLAPRLTRTPFVRTPDQGASMIVKLADDPSQAEVTGQFFNSVPGAHMLPKHRALRDVELQRRIWDRTAELVGLEP